MEKTGTVEWKWSLGEKYEKSERRTNLHAKNDTISQSLLSEKDPWGLDTSEFFKANKREETYNKMSEREMICQVNQNPFLSNSNYLEDIITHEQFMKPVSTSIEKEIK